MGPGVILDALLCANLATLRIGLKNLEVARAYCSQSVQRYNQIMGRGLPARNPVDYLYKEQGIEWTPDARCELPILRRDGGGTQPAESIILATVTRALQPRKIFEIGTFVGKTTSIFILNAPSDAQVFTLDLPEDTPVDSGKYIDTDVQLVQQRRLARVVHELGLSSRFTQILCDSMTFDPAPHAGSVELGFIDGAHAYEYVKNDTEKMAVMMADRGLVFWHDYGGAGRFRDLSEYLEDLGKRIPIFRVPNTTLAWAPASAVKALAR
jgi:predicted O-methyltransferase YrrM